MNFQNLKRIIYLMLAISWGLSFNSFAMSTPPSNPVIIQKPLEWNQQRAYFTQQYVLQHYSPRYNSIYIDPKLIVVHWTAADKLNPSFNTFNPVEMPNGARPDLGQDRVNTSAHFLIDRDGTIYQLMPEYLMARHVIGLNPVAIGIENVGGGPTTPHLTTNQLEANYLLVCFLLKKYPSIQNVIGHYQYGQYRNSPLWYEKDKAYFTHKTDPGKAFMSKLIKKLKRNGGYTFKK